MTTPICKYGNKVKIYKYSHYHTTCFIELFLSLFPFPFLLLNFIINRQECEGHDLFEPSVCPICVQYSHNYLFHRTLHCLADFPSSYERGEERWDEERWDKMRRNKMEIYQQKIETRIEKKKEKYDKKECNNLSK